MAPENNPLARIHELVEEERELRERSAWVTDLNFEARMDKPDWVVIDHHATEAPAKNAR